MSLIASGDTTSRGVALFECIDVHQDAVKRVTFDIDGHRTVLFFKGSRLRESRVELPAFGDVVLGVTKPMLILV